MHKKAKILFFCMIFVAGAVEAQNSQQEFPQNNSFFYTKTVFSKVTDINIYTAFHQNKYNRKSIVEKTSIRPLILPNLNACSSIAADYYTQGFGFFCKKELQFEKKTKIPLSFRLGTLQYNNYLEGKPNSGIVPSY